MTASALKRPRRLLGEIEERLRALARGLAQHRHEPLLPEQEAQRLHEAEGFEA